MRSPHRKATCALLLLVATACDRPTRAPPPTSPAPKRSQPAGNTYPFSDRIPADSPAVLVTRDLSIIADEARGRRAAWRQLFESGRFKPGSAMLARLPIRDRIALTLMAAVGPALDEASLGLSRDSAAAIYIDGKSVVIRAEVTRTGVATRLLAELFATHLKRARSVAIGDHLVHMADLSRALSGSTAPTRSNRRGSGAPGDRGPLPSPRSRGQGEG